MEGDNFDVELFIEQIKQHPTIWDVRCEEYKDREEKQSAWEEVCRKTFLDFEAKSENERTTILKKIALKWKNIKDNYMRSIRKRTKPDQPAGAVKRYIYAKHLSFLQETLAFAATQSSTLQPSLDSLCKAEGSPFGSMTSSEPASATATFEPSCYPATPGPPFDPGTPGPSYGAGRNPSSRRQKLESSLLKFMNTPVTVEPPDPNRLFFDSLLPMIKNFTEDQTLQFRGEVIETIRRIKRQHTVLPTHTTVTSRSQSSPSFHH